ncbi:MAG: hypothetical protein FD165_1249 [Gammaproteobacteria bacterium]|nr:MAG: hypothetical protein FD165_1249 [Gammaproteobacteria bacterium]TND07408.1 MAG: hypothetical protein FD120_146 [Gammaproteobacteria bacterium]
MPYITRDTSGKIMALYGEQRPDATEELPIEHPDLQPLLDQLRLVRQAKDQLSSLDSNMVRVIEDLVDVLIEKKVILATDLPHAAQEKLLGRQRLRQKMTALDDLMVGEDDII